MIGPSLWLLLSTQTPVSSCGVSEDPAFATTKEQAAQVGGGAAYGPARERRYLDALRGPLGERVEYTRRGSLSLDRDGRTILDRYEVTYRGAAQPATLYLDAYHYDDALVAPRGFLCAVPFGLAAPGPDAFMAADALRAVAIEQSARADIAPISLDPDGSATHGILLDSFRVVARAARAAAPGTPMDPKDPPRDLIRTRMFVVAYPMRCGAADPVPPAALTLVSSEGAAPARDGELAVGEALARLLPGMDLPRGAMGAVYPLNRPRVTDTLRITYPEPCGDVVLPFKYENGRPLNAPAAALPAGQPPTDRVVRVQAVIDLDGAVRQPVYVGGPPPLTEAAIAAVRTWTAEPVRLNGAPIVTPVVLVVKFR